MLENKNVDFVSVFVYPYSSRLRRTIVKYVASSVGLVICGLSLLDFKQFLFQLRNPFLSFHK